MYYYEMPNKVFHVALKRDKGPDWYSLCGKPLHIWDVSCMTEEIPNDGRLCTQCLRRIGYGSNDNEMVDSVRQKILEKANLLNEKASVAYHAFLMLQRLYECSKCYEEELALSPEFYFTVYISSRSLIFDTIENCYKNENRGNTIVSLLSNCKHGKKVFRESMSFNYRWSSDIKSLLPFKIQLPKLWEDVDVDFEFDFGVTEQNEDQPYITLKCDFFHFFEFMNGLWDLMNGLAEKVKQRYKKGLEKDNGGMKDWMAEMQENQSHRYWEYVQVLLQYQLILSTFIQNSLMNNSEVQAIPYENAADLENTLNAVRQGLDAKLTIV